MTAPLAEPVSMNVPLKQYPKVIFTRSTLTNAPIAELAQMYVLLKPYIRLNSNFL
jgi:hypothetical protein